VKGRLKAGADAKDLWQESDRLQDCRRLRSCAKRTGLVAFTETRPSCLTSRLLLPHRHR
jgi:hypothetical protein